MAWRGKEIDVIVLQIERNMSRGLGSVDHEGKVVAAGDCADLAKRLERSGDVGGVGEGNQRGVGTNRLAEVVRIDQAGGGIDGDARLIDPVVIGQRVERTED